MASTRSSTAAPDDDTSGAPLTSWYTQGVTDGFGDRLLMFDNVATGPIELLRIRPEFATTPGFESALRSRFSHLTDFNHPHFAQSRVVNHLDNGGGLTVASAHVTGTRVASLFEARRPSPGMHPGAVIEVFGDLVSAVGALHKLGGDIAHGALSADRVILTFDRRLVITDYIFGSALERMRLSAERLWNDFGLVGDPSTRRVCFDQRGDLTQLGLLMLCLVLGRRVTPDEYAEGIPSLLNEFTTASDRRAPDLTSRMRGWLERTIDPTGFESVSEAALALEERPPRPRYVELHAAKTLATGPSLPKQLLGPAANSSVPPAGNLTHDVSPAVPTAPAVTESLRALAVEGVVRDVSPGSVAHVPTEAKTSHDTRAPIAAHGETTVGSWKESPPLTHTAVPATTGPDRPSSPDESDAPGSTASSDEDRLWPTIIEAALVVGERAESGEAVRDDSTPQIRRHSAAPTPPSAMSVAPRPADEIEETAGDGTSWDDEAQMPPDLIAIDSRMSPFDVQPMTMSGSSHLSLRWSGAPDSTPDANALEVDPPTRTTPVMRWVVVALVTLAISQGVIILWLLSRAPRGAAVLHVDSPTPGDRVLLDGKDVGVTPLDVSLPSPRSTVRILPRSTDTATTSWSGAAQPPLAPGSSPTATATNAGVAVDATRAMRSVDDAAARTGDIRVVSPIPLLVMEGKATLGSSEQGRVSIAPGAHDLEFSNASVGFRTSQRVLVDAGGTAVVRIDPPNGLLSVTAQPWAQIWIDGRKVGDTPIANMPIAVGEHEVVFRNPKLGERRQKTIVQNNKVTRVTASFNP